jgi:hypothetical protein
MNNTFSIKESFSFAWTTFKKRPWLFIGVIFTAIVILGISSAVLAPVHGGNVIFRLIQTVIGIFVDMGLVMFALQAHDDVSNATWKNLWAPQQFWKYLGATILVGLITITGFILLIIPGVIAVLGLMFTKYLVIDRKLGPVQALKASWRITKGHKLHLLGFIIVSGLLNLAGAIALLIGLLVTVPLTMLAAAHVYRALLRAAPEAIAAA